MSKRQSPGRIAGEGADIDVLELGGPYGKRSSCDRLRRRLCQPKALNRRHHRTADFRWYAMHWRSAQDAAETGYVAEAPGYLYNERYCYETGIGKKQEAAILFACLADSVRMLNVTEPRENCDRYRQDDPYPRCGDEHDRVLIVAIW